MECMYTRRLFALTLCFNEIMQTVDKRYLWIIILFCEYIFSASFPRPHLFGKGGELVIDIAVLRAVYDQR